MTIYRREFINEKTADRTASEIAKTRSSSKDDEIRKSRITEIEDGSNVDDVGAETVNVNGLDGVEGYGSLAVKWLKNVMVM
ncbi:hypothetical protein L596_027177 [Steinernema carpocapsae]|uniref:Uncharacterized protein n=1 Tax=Steinernema carpocapsae TaxID=34508 RepID=A0A4U5M3M3_STECR|nr:hypothetical protein L596_027177 [Steinernema carpocapsae]